MHINPSVICKEKIKKLGPVNYNRILGVLRVQKALKDQRGKKCNAEI